MTRFTRYLCGWPGGDLLILLAGIFIALVLLWLIKEAALWIFVGG